VSIIELNETVYKLTSMTAIIYDVLDIGETDFRNVEIFWPK